MMNIVKSVYISVVVASMMLGVPSLAFASTVDYNDEPKEQEECEEDYPSLCSGSNGVSGKPFCDLWDYDVTMRAQSYPNATEGCWDRTTDPLAFCEEFDDLTSTYEDCRVVPGSEEYIEYLEIGGPDESCLFDVYQEKCLPSPITDDCPENFWTNEDGYCFPVNENGNWVCHEDYHDVDDDESGQCYPNSEECPGDTFLVPDEDEEDDGDRCAEPRYFCSEYNGQPDHPKCKEFLEEENNRMFESYYDRSRRLSSSL